MFGDFVLKRSQIVQRSCSDFVLLIRTDSVCGNEQKKYLKYVAEMG